VNDRWEWQPDLLRMRAQIERLFLDAVRAHVDPGHDDVAETEDPSDAPETGTGPPSHLREHGTRPQIQECFAHRSLYHLEEADPHAWVIPRSTGQATAALVAVEFDEDRFAQRLMPTWSSGRSFLIG
jgi:hypothetical protein